MTAVSVWRSYFDIRLAVTTVFSMKHRGFGFSIIQQGALICTGELIPVIGMGTWITFNVDEIQILRDQRIQVLKAFLDAGGTVIDSSPMYGSSEKS